MQHIDFFLASSLIDLHEQRMELSSYFRTLDERLLDHGFTLNLHMVEDTGDNPIPTQKQEEYNDLIRHSDFFLILFWHRMEAYTLDEYNVALEQFRKTGSPKISPCFCKMDQLISTDPSKIPPIEQEAKDFKLRLEQEIQQFYTEYTSLDTIKLKILLMLAARPELHLQVEFRDAKVFLDGCPLENLHLDALPLYNRHRMISLLRLNYAKLDQDYYDAKQAFKAMPDNAAIWEVVHRLTGEREQTAEQLHLYEAELLSVISRIVELTSNGEMLTERARRAAANAEEGKLKKAQDILENRKRRKDVEWWQKRTDDCQNNLRALLKETLIKIETLRAEGLNDERTEQIIELYEEAKTLIEVSQLDRTAVIDYMSFLGEQQQPDRSLEIGEEWLRSSLEQTSEPTLARLYALMGTLYQQTSRTEEAEQSYRNAISLYRSLAQKHPVTYKPEVAAVCNSLANLYRRSNRSEDAEAQYQESLEIYRGLAKEFAAFKSDAAATCNNLAVLYHHLERWQEAEALHKEALEIRRKLAKEHPVEYEPAVATTLCNLGLLYEELGKTIKMRPYIREAIALAEKYLDDPRCVRILDKLS